MQTVSNVASVAVEIQQSGHFRYESQRLFDEVTRYLGTVLGRETHPLVGKAEGTRGLYEHTGTLWLLRIVDKRVLVVVESPNHCNDEQDEYYDATIHPVDKNEKQDGGSTNSPKLPQEKGQHSTDGLSRTETHMSIGG